MMMLMKLYNFVARRAKHFHTCFTTLWASFIEASRAIAVVTKYNWCLNVAEGQSFRNLLDKFIQQLFSKYYQIPGLTGKLQECPGMSNRYPLDTK